MKRIVTRHFNYSSSISIKFTLKDTLSGLFEYIGFKYTAGFNGVGSKYSASLTGLLSLSKDSVEDCKFLFFNLFFT